MGSFSQEKMARLAEGHERVGVCQKIRTRGGKGDSMKKNDLRLSMVLLAIFITLYALSYTFQASVVVETHTTAAFFPRVVLVFLMFMTLLLIIRSVVRGKTVAEEKMDRAQLKRVLATMGLSVLLLLGALFLGTFVSLALFIVATMLTWGVRNKMTIFLNAVLTPVLIYLIFTKVLMVQFPSGILM
jgi:hypothetical protein